MISAYVSWVNEGYIFKEENFVKTVLPLLKKALLSRERVAKGLGMQEDTKKVTKAVCLGQNSGKLANVSLKALLEDVMDAVCCHYLS